MMSVDHDTDSVMAIVRDWDGTWRLIPLDLARLEQRIDDELFATPPLGGGMD